jgi:tripartite-type tricarboxylate transporter receptor subunit TctC
MAEAGRPDFDTSLWFGVMAPAGTPQTVIEKIASAAEKAMHGPEAVEALKKQGFDPLGKALRRLGITCAAKSAGGPKLRAAPV